MKPLLKWPGGKRFLAQTLVHDLIKLPIKRYFEPFAGGAALFFAMRPTSAVLSDANEELINFYKVVRDQPDTLMDVLRRYTNSHDDYYNARRSVPRTSHTRAARLYYLMRLSFNGIYRENQKGNFNVPYGYKTYLSVYDREAIRDASVALQSAGTISCQDFRQCADEAQQGDLVYFDPPYTVRQNRNGFVKYNSHLFAWNDQIALATLAKQLAVRGCYVVVSNANHEDVRDLYGGFTKHVISRLSVISAQSAGRRVTTEQLMLSPNIPTVSSWRF